MSKDQKIRVGMRVKCFDDYFVDSSQNPFRSADLNLPKKGKMYTVREVIKNRYGIGLRLEEIHNQEYYFDDIGRYEEPTFSEHRFLIGG